MIDFKGLLKNMDKNAVLVTIAVVGILVAGGLIYANSTPGFSLTSVFGFGMSKDEVAKKAVDYINNNQLAQGTVTLISVSEESGLIKLKINLGTSEVDSYISKDGKLLFPYVYNIADVKEDDTADTGADATEVASCDTLTKTDKPVLEAYVVARCPFGLQMQRAMADAINSVPSLAEYFKARYMGGISNGKITAMHGDAEAQENLRQICIREEQPAKYWSYVGCQMKAANTEKACEISTGVDSARLASCISDPKKGLAYAQVDFDLNDKYKVTGSPTLILGDARVSETGFGGRSSDALKSIVCCASKNQPSFCSTKLNTAAAASSFSATYSTASGSAGATANCGE